MLADGWRVDSVEPIAIEVNIDPAGIRSWVAAVSRTWSRAGQRLAATAPEIAAR